MLASHFFIPWGVDRAYHAVDFAEHFLYFADLSLVLQENWRIEVRNLHS